MCNVSSVSPHQSARTVILFAGIFSGETEAFIKKTFRNLHGLSSASDKSRTSSVSPIIFPSKSADHKAGEL